MTMKWAYRKSLALLWMLLLLAACGSRDVAGTQNQTSAPATAPSPAPEQPSIAPATNATAAPTLPTVAETRLPKPSLDTSSTKEPEQPTMSNHDSDTAAEITPQGNVSSVEPTVRESSTDQSEEPDTSPLESPALVTLADNNRPINIAVGSTLQIQLDSGFEWQFTVGDEQMLAPVTPADSAVSGNMSYLARTVGQTTVDAVGSPPCAKSDPPCRAPSIAFSVVVTVR